MPSKANKKKAAAEKSEAARAAAQAAAPEEQPFENAPAPEPVAAAPAPVPAPAASAPTAAAPRDRFNEKKEVLPPLTPPAKLIPLPKGTVELKTNSFPMKIIKPVKLHRYDVSICKERDDMTGSDPLELVGTKGGDRKKQEDCNAIVQAAIAKLRLAERYVYDGAATIYFLHEINDTSVTFDSNSPDLPADIKRAHFSKGPGRFVVRFSANRLKPALKTDGIFKENLKNMESGDKSLTAVFQMLLVQDAKKNDFIVLDGGSQLYNSKSRKPKTNVVEEVEGVGAGVKLAEGADKKGEVQVVIDYKLTQFFTAGPFLNLYSTVQSGNFNKFFHGIKIGTTYSSQEISGFTVSKVPVGQLPAIDGAPFLNKCSDISGIPVRDFNVNLPAVEKTFKRGRESNTFHWAMETLTIQPNQKLAPHHGEPPRCPKPKVRYEATERVANAAKILGAKNETLHHFGAEVAPKPLSVNAFSVYVPKIVYTGGQVEPNLENKASWFMKAPLKFISPANWEKVLLVYHSQSAGSRAHEIASAMKEGLSNQARISGMTINSWGIEDLSQTFPGKDPITAIGEKLQAIAKSTNVLTKRPYVIFLDNPSEPTHGVLKLNERRWQVLCQHLNFGKSAKVDSGRHTLNNILMKMNVKMGGQNHHVLPSQNIAQFWGQNSNTLFISYDVCHSSGGGDKMEPSVVGITYNVSKNPETITGDFHFQVKGRTEEVGQHILEFRAQKIMEAYMTARGKVPEHVIILRDGVSEGQYRMVLGHEVPSIKKGINAHLKLKNIKTSPKMAVIVATKRHNNRLYQVKGQDVVNIRPLLAVDHTVVRQDANEILFVSHAPLGGTCQPILLNIMMNEGVFEKNEQIVNLMATLCATHQASSNIVSLPETIYAADEYAKRGADIFATFKKSNKVPELAKSENDKEAIGDFEKLTGMLCYEASGLKGRRMV